MRISTQQFFQQGINRIQDQYVNLSRIQEQIASGKRLLAPSDDPSAAARVLEISNALETNAQFQTNSNITIGRLEQEDSVLHAASNVIQRTRELVIQGKNATLSPTDRQFISDEIRELLGEMIGLGNTRSSNGEFIFGGYKTTTQSFTQNSTGTVNYNGDKGQRQLQISEVRTVPDGNNGSDTFMDIVNGNGVFRTDIGGTHTGFGIVSVGTVTDQAVYNANEQTYTITYNTGTPDTVSVVGSVSGAIMSQNYLDGGSIQFNGLEVAISGTPANGDTFTITPSSNQSVFATLTNTINALESNQGNDAERSSFLQEMDKALTDLDQSLENFLGIRASVGARLKTLDVQKEVNNDLVIELRKVRAELEDVDIVSAIAKLTSEQAALQASQQAFVRIQGLSLFNFL